MLNPTWLEADESIARRFRQRRPYPFQSLTGFLEPEAFAALRLLFPGRVWFEKHENIRRWGGQRPHDRFYLALDANRYRRRKKPAGFGPGAIGRGGLCAPWRDLIRQLEGAAYRVFLKRMLGEEPGKLRFAWHLSGRGNEVSPHFDSPKKLATHIFYLHDTTDWQRSWGGETLILADRKRAVRNPELADFEEVAAVGPVGNASLLFANAPEAWHGMRPLRCPCGVYRKSFHVIIGRA